MVKTTRETEKFLNHLCTDANWHVLSYPWCCSPFSHGGRVTLVGGVGPAADSDSSVVACGKSHRESYFKNNKTTFTDMYIVLTFPPYTVQNRDNTITITFFFLCVCA